MQKLLFSRFLSLSVLLLIQFASNAQELCDRTGISNGWMLDQTSAEIDRITEACAATRAKYFRADFAWSDVQWNGVDEWNWNNIDRLVESALSQDLELIGILTYFPPWTDQNADTIFWSNFVYEVGLRYIPQGIRVFEMWNEPNLSNFFPQPNVEDYVQQILIPGSNAIRKAAAELEVEITVISGGLAPAATDGINISQLDFVTGLYDFGAKDYFDALGQHPYCWPLAPDEESDFNWFLKTEELRDVMLENGDADKLIWGTEMGWPTHLGATGVSEILQAQYLSKSYDLWNDWEWTGPLIWYAYNNAGDNPSEPEDNFGLTDSNLNPKPSLNAFTNVIDNCLLDSNTQDDDNLTSVNIYPNPNHGEFFIDTGVTSFEISLMSPDGKQLLKVEDTSVIKISAFESGIYFLIYKEAGRSQVFKLLLF